MVPTISMCRFVNLPSGFLNCPGGDFVCHLLSCMMWRKRSGFGYFRVFYQLFPIHSPSLNLQEVMRVFVLYECGVCPSIVFLTLSRTWCCFLTEILFFSRVVRVSYVQGVKL